MTSDTASGPYGRPAADAGAAARLCALFAAALELDHVTPDTDFFLAGGHSLSALALAVSVEEAFGVRVRVRDVFEAATPLLLADRLATLTPRARPVAPAPPRADAAGPRPGTEVGDATRWLWLERQRDAGRPGAYTVPCLLDGEGRPDAERLRGALVALAGRHPALRTVFTEHRGEPRAVLTDDVPPLDVVDLGGDDADDARFAALVDDRVAVTFDPAGGPLTRAVLFLRGGGRWSLLLLADHLVCDGRSLEILATQLVAGCAAPGEHTPPVTGPPTEPLAEPRAISGAALAYWRGVLEPAPAPLPLPVRGPRTEPVGARTGIAARDIGPDTLRRLTRMGERHHAGPFAPLTAAVARTLAAITGGTDICVGTAVDRRARLGARDAVGFHVTTVPLRLDVRAAMSADDLVGQVARRTVDAVDHSDLTFDALVAALDPPRVPGRTPFFDVWVALYPRIDTGPCPPGGIALRGGPTPLRTGMFELSFQFVERAEGMRLLLQYDVARYAPGTAERMVGRLADEVTRLLRNPAGPAPGASPAPRAFGGFRFDT